MAATTWRVGVFRPLLHHVASDARHLHIRGMDVQFSICGLATVGATQPIAALSAAAKYCHDCLAADREGNP